MTCQPIHIPDIADLRPESLDELRHSYRAVERKLFDDRAVGVYAKYLLQMLDASIGLLEASERRREIATRALTLATLEIAQRDLAREAA